jgi:predicted Zn-dependent protease
MRQFNWTSRTWLLGLLMVALTGCSEIGDTPQADAYQKHFEAAKSAQLRRDFVRAQAELAECLKIRKDDPEVHFLAARTARRSGDFKKAETHLKECQRLKGDAAAINLEQLLLRAQRGEIAVLGTKEVTAVAKDLTKFVNEKHPETPLILEGQAQGYAAAYRHLEALTCWDALLKHESKNTYALVKKARILRDLQASESAVETYRKALALNPDLFEARLGLAEIFLEEKRISEAKENLDKLHQNHSRTATVVLGLAKCDFYQGQPKSAEKRLVALLAEQPRNGEAWYLRGKVEDDPARAEKCFRKALELDPNAPEYNYSLFICLMKMDKQEEAKQAKKRYEKIVTELRHLVQLMQKVESKPHDASLRSEVGKILLQHGKEQAGLAWLNSALQDDPNHRPTHLLLADYFERAGQKEQAAKHRRLAKEKK